MDGIRNVGGRKTGKKIVTEKIERGNDKNQDPLKDRMMKNEF